MVRVLVGDGEPLHTLPSLGAALQHYWDGRGRLAEGEAWLDRRPAVSTCASPAFSVSRRKLGQRLLNEHAVGA